MEDPEKINVKKYICTISEKITVLRKYHSKDPKTNKDYTKKEICRQYKIDHKTLEEWLLKEELFKNFPNQKSRKSMTTGKKTSFTEEEQNHIINFVESAIANYVPISFLDVTINIDKLNLKTLSGLSLNAKYLRIIRFLKSKYYVNRKSTHIGQSIPENSNELCMKFLKEVIRKRNKYEYDLDCIINADETPVYLDSPYNYCIAKKGTHIITIRTLGIETARLTVLLSITANGNKLKPFIIFKGKGEIRLYQNLQKFKQVRDGSIVIYSQDNAWMNSNLFCKYIKEVLAEYYPKKKKIINFRPMPRSFK